MEEINAEHQKINGELRKEIESADHLASVEFIEKNYISKDKIKAKIKFLNDEGYWEFLEQRDVDEFKKILQELLED